MHHRLDYHQQTLSPMTGTAVRGPLTDMTNQACTKDKLRVPSGQLRQLRHAMSQPILRTRNLRASSSRIDMLEKGLVSFPDVEQLVIFDDYFPRGPQALREPLNPTSNSWQVLLYKKLRWRWRIKGLVH